MEILGIGPLEFVFIVLIALIVLGPKDMVKAGRTVGRILRKIVTSSEWRTIQQASKEFRYLPNRLIREAGLEELKNEISNENLIGGQMNFDRFKSDYDQWKQDISTWTTPPTVLLEENESEVDLGQDHKPNQNSETEDSEQN